MTHLTRDDLERWCAAGAPADRQRIVAHLAECDACGALLGHVRDALQESPTPDHDLVASLKTIGYGAYRPARRPAPVWRRWGVAAAAAAALVLVVLFLPMRRGPADTPDESAVRGSSIQLLSPAGSVNAIEEFRWTSPIRATSFRVEVYEAGQRRVSEINVTVEHARPSEDDRRRLATPGAYTWLVVALDQAGLEIMRSKPQEVVVAGRE